MTHDASKNTVPNESGSEKVNLPVIAGVVIDHHTPSGKPVKKRARNANVSEDPAFNAQVLSGGEKRGLKGGSATLDRAKSTYLASEYSGPNDRRPSPGRITKTEI